MTRKDFVFFTVAIKDFGYPQERSRLAQHFANYFAKSNPRFDRNRFLKACGVAS
jgi:hypothetical protein